MALASDGKEPAAASSTTPCVRTNAKASAIVTTSHHPTSLKPGFSPIERSFYSADPFGNKLRSGDERTLFTAGLI